MFGCEVSGHLTGSEASRLESAVRAEIAETAIF